MDRLEAVQAAKQYITDLYSGEGISKTRLEELNFDHENLVWLITVGFAYPNTSSQALRQIPALASAVYGDRQYKLVRVNDESGEVVGMTDRMLDPSLPR